MYCSTSERVLAVLIPHGCCCYCWSKRGACSLVLQYKPLQQLILLLLLWVAWFEGVLLRFNDCNFIFVYQRNPISIRRRLCSPSNAAFYTIDSKFGWDEVPLMLSSLSSWNTFRYLSVRPSACKLNFPLIQTMMM